MPERDLQANIEDIADLGYHLIIGRLSTGEWSVLVYGDEFMAALSFGRWNAPRLVDAVANAANELRPASRVSDQETHPR